MTSSRFAILLLLSAAALPAADPVSAPASSSAAPSKAPVSGPPIVTSWIAPEYPPELRASNTEGNAIVQFIVDDKGAISQVRALKASHPAFGAAAVASVEKWVCEPALEEGKPIASGVVSKLFFKLPYNPSKLFPPLESLPAFAKRTAAVGEETPLPAYPPVFEPRRLNGEVMFDIEVNAEGSVSHMRLLGATHPAFVRIARDGVASWKFKPALQGDLPVASKARVPVHYSVYVPSFEEGVPTQLEANGFSLRPPPEVPARRLCDVPPEIWVMVDPVYPHD